MIRSTIRTNTFVIVGCGSQHRVPGFHIHHAPKKRCSRAGPVGQNQQPDFGRPFFDGMADALSWVADVF